MLNLLTDTIYYFEINSASKQAALATVYLERFILKRSKL
jgi:hypothetical protein